MALFLERAQRPLANGVVATEADALPATPREFNAKKYSGLSPETARKYRAHLKRLLAEEHGAEVAERLYRILFPSEAERENAAAEAQRRAAADPWQYPTQEVAPKAMWTVEHERGWAVLTSLVAPTRDAKRGGFSFEFDADTETLRYRPTGKGAEPMRGDDAAHLTQRLGTVMDFYRHVPSDWVNSIVVVATLPPPRWATDASSRWRALVATAKTLLLSPLVAALLKSSKWDAQTLFGVEGPGSSEGGTDTSLLEYCAANGAMPVALLGEKHARLLLQRADGRVTEFRRPTFPKANLVPIWTMHDGKLGKPVPMALEIDPADAEPITTREQALEWLAQQGMSLPALRGTGL
jgi:hypothetical protein